MLDNIFGNLFEEHRKKWAQIEELSKSIKELLEQKKDDVQVLDHDIMIRQLSQLVLHLVEFLKPPVVADLDKSLTGFKDELSKIILSKGKK